MYISVTGLNKWTNPEEFRLTYLALGHGIVPEEKDPYQARGTSFHAWAEGSAKKWTPDEVIAKLKEDGIEDESIIDMGEKLNLKLQEYLNKNKIEIIESEFEFEIPIQGKLALHSLVGKVDAVGKTFDKLIIVPEYKSTQKTKPTKEYEKEWRVARQADTEILGARMKGYDPAKMQVIYVPEYGEPESIPVTRSEYQLEYTLQSIAQNCDMITMMIEQWGVDTPWPHDIPSIWNSDMRGRCNSDSDTFTCAYKDICGSRLACIPEGFKAREEYLEILKVKKNERASV